MADPRPLVTETAADPRTAGPATIPDPEPCTRREAATATASSNSPSWDASQNVSRTSACRTRNARLETPSPPVHRVARNSASERASTVPAPILPQRHKLLPIPHPGRHGNAPAGNGSAPATSATERKPWREHQDRLRCRRPTKCPEQSGTGSRCAKMPPLNSSGPRRQACNSTGLPRTPRCQGGNRDWTGCGTGSTAERDHPEAADFGRAGPGPPTGPGSAEAREYPPDLQRPEECDARLRIRTRRATNSPTVANRGTWRSTEKRARKSGAEINASHQCGQKKETLKGRVCSGSPPRSEPSLRARIHPPESPDTEGRDAPETRSDNHGAEGEATWRRVQVGTGIRRTMSSTRLRRLIPETGA